jgi:hypothetical protein
VVLHSLAFSRHKAKRRGEIDFLVIAPAGVFAIEVKAGRVARREGIWVHTDRWGEEHQRPESPFEQAAGAMFSIEAKLREALSISGSFTCPLFGYGVMLPDARASDVGMGLEQRSVLWCDDDRAEPLASFLSRIAASARASQNRPTSDLQPADIATLTRFLRGDFEAVESLRSQTGAIEDQAIKLTQRQLRIIDRFEDQARVVVEGGAGTGKSLLAAEAARREARHGRRTALLCYNRFLHASLSATVAADAATSQLSILRTTQLLYGVVKSAGRESEWSGDWSNSTGGPGLEDLVGDCLMSETSPRFDCLIIDEAQDVLSPIVYDALDCLLVGGMSAGRWRAFMDPSNQAGVYSKCDVMLLNRFRSNANVHHLTINCRNTRQVVEYARAASGHDLDEALIDGPAVEPCWYETPAGPAARTRKAVAELIARGADPGRISILCPKRETVADLVQSNGQSPLVRELDEQAAVAIASGTHDLVSVTTVSSFKGLENDIVVLAGLENFDGDWWGSVAYVGITRAKTLLVPVLPTSAQSQCRARGLI